ncbi:MAG: RdgB/HAM1 family non-canonical purine NTP pyrophosphatase [Immundisolibacteraceae bacterium]|nr:RdgB/HAM1 family non-canonical purine NTP pyrophosphatase [Immundisolibacteraceae bacterium]
MNKSGSNRRLVLASRNAGKLADFSLLFMPLNIELVSVTEFTDVDVEETGATFIENALLKARHAAAVSGLPALADDSGLVVDYLGGEPGIFSARYAGEPGSDQGNNQKLLGKLSGVNSADRSAHFHCSLALLASAEDPAPLIAEGRWRGRIAEQLAGSSGFGYDPLFLPEGLSGSAAELSSAQKNSLSHRGQALHQLVPAMAGWVGFDFYRG